MVLGDSVLMTQSLSLVPLITGCINWRFTYSLQFDYSLAFELLKS